MIHRKLKRTAVLSRKLPTTNEKSIKRCNDRLKRRLNREKISTQCTVSEGCQSNSIVMNKFIQNNVDPSSKIINKCVSDFVDMCPEPDIVNDENKLSDICGKDQDQSDSIQDFLFPRKDFDKRSHMRFVSSLTIFSFKKN